MINETYKSLAKYYDIFYSSREYSKEFNFIHNLFSDYSVKSLLDVGCGTGYHLQFFEENGYDCFGVDINQEMLDIAKSKVLCPLIQNDMRYYKLNKVFDGIVCLFAAFNHITNLSDASITINNMKSHLKSGGLLFLDLYNCKKSGKKEETIGNVIRKMSFVFDPKTNIEYTDILFYENGDTLISKHIMRIYSIKEITSLLESSGFNVLGVYENFTLKKGNNYSNNLQFLAKLL